MLCSSSTLQALVRLLLTKPLVVLHKPALKRKLRNVSFFFPSPKYYNRFTKTKVSWQNVGIPEVKLKTKKDPNIYTSAPAQAPRLAFQPALRGRTWSSALRVLRIKINQNSSFCSTWHGAEWSISWREGRFTYLGNAALGMLLLSPN